MLVYGASMPWRTVSPHAARNAGPLGLEFARGRDGALMTDNSQALEPAKSQLRVGIVKDGCLVCRILVSASADGQAEVTVNGDEAAMQTLAPVIKATIEGTRQGTLSSEEWREAATHSLSAALGSNGFEVVKLPPHDLSAKFEFDFRSGLLVGKHDGLHPYVAVDTPLARRLHEAVAGAFKKGSLELAAEIETLVQNGDHAGAARALEEGRSGTAFFGVPAPELLVAVGKINAGAVDAELRIKLRRRRCAIAAGANRYDLAEPDAIALLDEDASLDDVLRASLNNSIAVASVKRGEVETALSMWRALLAKPDVIDAGERGWIWRNISYATKGGEAERAMRSAGDAFLEAGDKREAAATLMQLSRMLEQSDSASALAQLDDMQALVADKGLIGSELSAMIYHARASRLVKLRNFPEAFDAAMKAVALRRGVTGVEDDLITSLHLAAISGRGCGNNVTADDLDAEAKRLEGEISSQRFALGRRLMALTDAYEAAELDAIEKDAMAAGERDVVSTVAVIRATVNPDLQATQRLRLLETALSDSPSKQAKQAIMLAIASVLRNDGQHQRAADWYRKILKDDPFRLDARELLIDSLWRSEAWGDAAIFLKSQIDIHGDAPGLLYAYGRSLLEAGDISGCIPVLTRALKLITPADKAHAPILALRERALEMGGTVPVEPAAATPRPILRDEIEEGLRQFSAFISGEKRMRFWERPDPQADYKWTAQPERCGQDFLHTYIKAKFQDRVSVFEEIATGAGRLDMLLKVDGGLSVIIELKMCGFGYSSAYAASGEDQIRHYMEQRKVHVGYLLIFDARLNDFSGKLLAPRAGGQDTICEIFVDMRPRVTRRSS